MANQVLGYADAQCFSGYIETTEDALRIAQAARMAKVPRVTRRLNEQERRSMIKSGAVFVFDVRESSIRRWTEGELHLIYHKVQQNIFVNSYFQS
jgi:Gti1/Pac2 family transcription factor